MNKSGISESDLCRTCQHVTVHKLGILKRAGGKLVRSDRLEMSVYTAGCATSHVLTADAVLVHALVPHHIYLASSFTLPRRRLHMRKALVCI